MVLIRGVVLMMVFMVGAVHLSYAADNQAQILTPDQMKMAMDMNKAYASHMYSSVCFDRDAAFVPKILGKEERAKKLAAVQKSCDCMTEAIIKETSPNDVIDYVTERYGVTKKLPKMDRDGGVELSETPQFTKIRQMTFSTDIRRKCGFSQ